VTNTHRDDVIRRAVARGCFSERRAPAWRAAWDRDPTGTEQTIGELAAADPNLLTDPGDSTVSEDEMKRLFSGVIR
jgi:hypothetical protein